MTESPFTYEVKIPAVMYKTRQTMTGKVKNDGFTSASVLLNSDQVVVEWKEGGRWLTAGFGSPQDIILTSQRQLMFFAVTLTGGDNTITLKINPGCTAMLEAAIAERRGAGAPVAIGSAAEELRRFAQLRDDGIISAEEFEAQKARLLSG